MSVKVDIPKSEQSRAEGNTAFKKGKWVEAIGHYTNAAVYNPQDPTAYTNRAQAFLKLDKYNDAERDCDTVLSLERGKGNIKALYRRALARKGLNKLDAAMGDIQQALKLDKSNEQAKAELAELEQMKKAHDAKKAQPRRPLSPVQLTSPRTETALAESPTSHSLPVQTEKLSLSAAGSPASSPASAQADPPALDQNISATATTPSSRESTAAPSPPASSFASLRQARDGKRKAFAGSPSVGDTLSGKSASAQVDGQSISAPPSGPTVAAPPRKPREPPSTSSPTSAPTSASTSASPKQSRQRPATSPDPTATASPTLPALPSNLDTTSGSPGTGLILLRHLTPSPASNWSLLSLYPAENVPKILAALLEPDNLGLLLLALQFGLDAHDTANDEVDDDAKRRIRTILVGLRRTKRWGMNVAMLTKQERQAGERVWRACVAAEDGKFV